MHATAGSLPDGTGWLCEVKYDGYRVLAGMTAGRPRIHYRRGSEGTESWPEIAAALALLPWDHVILDGELVVLDGDRPTFSRVQERFGVTRRRDALAAARRHPAQLLAFDLLALGDLDLRGLPLVERKSALREVLAGVHPVLRYVDHVEGPTKAAELQRRSRELGGEGVLAKRARSRYLPGRSREWIKVRQRPTFDFVVVGYSRPGDRVGALHVAGFHQSQLAYVGSVRTGFPRGFFENAHGLLSTIARPEPPCLGVATDVAETWVEPRIVVEVAYVEATPTGIVRHAEFVRLRPDKAADECRLPEGFGAGIEGRPLHRRRARW